MDFDEVFIVFLFAANLSIIIFDPYDRSGDFRSINLLGTIAGGFCTLLFISRYEKEGMFNSILLLFGLIVIVFLGMSYLLKKP